MCSAEEKLQFCSGCLLSFPLSPPLFPIYLVYACKGGVCVCARVRVYILYIIYGGQRLDLGVSPQGLSTYFYTGLSLDLGLL